MESNSVCKRVIDKIRFLFMITDRIGRHEVPLPISRNRYNVRENKWILFSERAFEYQMSKIRENITAGDTV